MKDIKPIETFYKGYRFRSRLEARWAVFFDALGVKWEYEPEGFELPSGKRYLPDFKVDCYGTRGDVYNEVSFPLYIEVKGVMTREDAEKIREFSGLNKIDEWAEKGCVGDFPEIKNPVLIVGNIPERTDRYGCGGTSSSRFGSYEQMNGIDIYPFNYETIDGDHFAAYPTAWQGHFYLMGDDSNYVNGEGEELMDTALDMARQARFEHGEKPVTRRK